LNWDPKIIAFCCNWCSYAGADLAGVSRFQYQPNVRIIRVMCSGRVENSFILNALRRGADGVIVTGCHKGDCHYISGNEKAEKRIETARHLLGTLGLEPERLGLEWISASEGQRFAKTMTDFVETIRKLGPNELAWKDNPGSISRKGTDTCDPALDEKEEGTGFNYCIECNKCASSCPITRVKSSYSPTKNVMTVSMEKDPCQPVLADVWECLTCGTCSQRCPSGVRYEELIAIERAKAIAMGKGYRCAHGEALKLVTDFHTEKDLKQNRLGWITDDLKVANKGEVLYFVGCQPYLKDTIFSDGTERNGLERIGPETLNVGRSSIRLLNRAGITPVVLPNERCCGHDALWTGDEAKFKKLARLNIDLIRASGAKVVVVSCAEGYRTLKLDYPKHFGDLGFEVVHTSEYFDKLIKEGKLVPTSAPSPVVAYQDPCRLGRHANVIEEPRSVLAAIPDMKVVELGLGGRDTTCCGGPNAWANCGQANRLMQFEKFREAKASGARTVVTACPKCLIHLRCALSSRLPNDLSDLDLDFMDINVLLDKATSDNNGPAKAKGGDRQ
jgi:heterodisulfide reductase subunit D